MAVVGLRHPPNLNLHIQLPVTPKSIEPCHAPLHLPTNTTTQDQEVDSLSDLETLEVLGNGSGGRVYKVRHSRTLAVYALKVIPGYPASMQALREIEIFSSTSSPFVVGYRGAFQNPSGEIAILMEYMDAGTLDNLVKTNGSFTEAMIANIARQGLKGLSYIHEKKIVHQDIKPSNLLVNQKMEVKIADFGVSRMVNSSHDPCDACAGTCAYMSPERFDSET
ncbi:hypothetical protein RJ639_021961 [Escallonia herrerae]|uniref:mitogen-activated protein kinase kinase n=1 Tax=Escallonia herrerae TaxID=1293975 RepID=A0AA88V3S0_9ASTE|nr:hypothetical protein RJ639_021961 [Escallonia herrerae]